MISLHYTSHTKAYNTIYTACNIVETIYSFTQYQTVSLCASLVAIRPLAWEKKRFSCQHQTACITLPLTLTLTLWTRLCAPQSSVLSQSGDTKVQ